MNNGASLRRVQCDSSSACSVVPAPRLAGQFYLVAHTRRLLGSFDPSSTYRGAWKWKESRTRFPGLKRFTTPVMMDVLAFHTMFLLFPVAYLLTPLAESSCCRLSGSGLCQSLCAEPDRSELISNYGRLASSVSLSCSSMSAYVHFLKGKESRTDI